MKFHSKTCFNVLDLNNFFNKLENAITSDASMDTIKLPINSIDQYNITEYEKKRDLDELKQIDEKYKRIINYLERNKYRITTERKISILQTWFYWLSASNFKIMSIHSQ